LKDFKVKAILPTSIMSLRPIGATTPLWTKRFEKVGQQVYQLDFPHLWRLHSAVRSFRGPTFLFRPSKGFAAKFGGKWGIFYILHASVFYRRLTRLDVGAPHSVSGLFRRNKDRSLTWFVVEATNLNEHRDRDVIVDRVVGGEVSDYRHY